MQSKVTVRFDIQQERLNTSSFVAFAITVSISSVYKTFFILQNVYVDRLDYMSGRDDESSDWV